MAVPTLTGLPLELKRQILQDLLIVEGPIYMKPPILEHPVSATFPGEKSGLHPSIILACKMFTNEGLAMLYNANIFFFKTVRTLQAFVNSISRFSRHARYNNLHRVQHVCLGVSSEFLDYLKLGQFAGHFPHLSIVDLNSWYADQGKAPTMDRCVDYYVRRMREELNGKVDAVVREVNYYP
ncbi:hypothetical protein MMC18_001298 [Xylographa bjoerkii]|nr:hypothetical protein [Xylographa bjoerkii]